MLGKRLLGIQQDERYTHCAYIVYDDDMTENHIIDLAEQLYGQTQNMTLDECIAAVRDEFYSAITSVDAIDYDRRRLVDDNGTEWSFDDDGFCRMIEEE